MLALLLSASSCLPKRESMNYYIFSDISECYQLETKDADIEKYETPDSDKYLKALEYTNFYGVKYKSSECEFEIFAYEFKDADTAKQYYTNVTGKTDPFDCTFSSSTGMASCRLAVIDFERGYIAKTTSSSKYIEAMKKILGEVFSKQIVRNGVILSNLEEQKNDSSVSAK